MNRPGRNDACSCGSGSKYKKCCLPKDEAAHAAEVAAAAATAAREAADAAAASGDAAPAPARKTSTQPHIHSFSKKDSSRPPPAARRRSV